MVRLIEFHIVQSFDDDKDVGDEGDNEHPCILQTGLLFFGAVIYRCLYLMSILNASQYLQFVTTHNHR